MRITVTFGLTNDERCLIHGLRVKKHCTGFRKNYETCFQINEHGETVNNA